MKIDWFTFAAQIVNFLVLVALLRWLLYDPIVRAMKKREEKIAGRLEEADRKREEAEEKVQEYEEKSRQLDQKRDELLKEARHEAHEEQQRLLKEAKQESIAVASSGRMRYIASRRISCRICAVKRAKWAFTRHVAHWRSWPTPNWNSGCAMRLPRD
jgi:vacuolar-type H+-ATPase subunit H